VDPEAIMSIPTKFCRRSGFTLWDMAIDVIAIRRLGRLKLELEFSDGTIGTRDFESILQRTGEVIAQLKDPAY
jgi:hypothetical protein